MYRPNRVGPWPVVDLDLTIPSWPTEWNTNFNNVDVGVGTLAPHFYSATVKDDYDAFTWFRSTSQLAADNSVSFAVAVNGEALNDQGSLLSFDGTFGFARAAAAQRTINFFVGRLGASTVDVVRTAANNSVANPYFLESVGSNVGSGGLKCSGSLVHVDSGADGHGSNPIVFGVQLVNPDTGAMDMENILVSLSLHKYNGDLPIFDARR